MKNNSSFTLSKFLLNLGLLVGFMLYGIPAKAQLLLVPREVQSFETDSRCVEIVRKTLIKKGLDRYAKRSDEGNVSIWSVEISTGGSIVISCGERKAFMGAIALDQNAESSLMDNYQLLKNTLLDEASQAQAPVPLNPPTPLPVPAILPRPAILPLPPLEVPQPK